MALPPWDDYDNKEEPMTVTNPEVLYADGTCKMLIAGKFCGGKETDGIHQTADGHEFQEEAL